MQPEQYATTKAPMFQDYFWKNLKIFTIFSKVTDVFIIAGNFILLAIKEWESEPPCCSSV